MCFWTDKKTISTKNVMISIIGFVAILLLMSFTAGNSTVNFQNINILEYLILFLVGILASATMVIPGISGSLVLLLIGYYEPIVNTVKSLMTFNNMVSDLLILIPFSIGIIVGIILISKLINYLLNKYPVITYYAIYGIVFSSIACIIAPLDGFNLANTSLGIFLAIIGFIITYKLGKRK